MKRLKRALQRWLEIDRILQRDGIGVQRIEGILINSNGALSAVDIEETAIKKGYDKS